MGILHQFTRRIVWRRLAEPSTWAGIVALVTGVLGVTLDPEQREAVVAAGVALVGLLSVFIREASPSQVAKSMVGAATSDNPTDADRVRSAVKIAEDRADDPPWAPPPAPAADPIPRGNRDSHNRLRNVPADDPRSS